ncbi:hypothetical protein Taro_034894 [Colocasia esculenta]|uniref:Uncharacterized protein n=1 Tax=Colocasia esculenta TaxID=4460 RepID=A0A843WGW8_COLES|nr:hypothetical protein [Colocasia esculenta]
MGDNRTGGLPPSNTTFGAHVGNHRLTALLENNSVATAIAKLRVLQLSTLAEEKCEGVGSSEEDQEASEGETEHPSECDPRAEDRELKQRLLKKYSGYLRGLKQEKKKTNCQKMPGQKLLNWWELHYKWPYPSEEEKVALAESTGLGQKQINNWFINQRKRHWKPSDDMQFVVMDGLPLPECSTLPSGWALHFLGDGMYRLGPP